MSRSFRILIMAGVATLLAPAAMASTPDGPPSGDCEVDNDCGAPPTPTKEPLPFQAVSKGANYFTYPNQTVMQGESYYNYHAGDTYIAGLGQGVGAPFGDDVYSYGGANSSATVQSFFAPTPTVAATAHQGNDIGRANASASIQYVVTLSAPDTATANSIAAFLQSHALATVQGYYTLTASGYASADASVYSSWGPDGDTSYSASTLCDTGAHSGNCGTTGFDFNLGFLRGTDFADGQANDFYAQITLSGTATAGTSGGIFVGDGSAYIDPTITLAPQLNQYGVTLSIGSFGPAAAVPEPASWAMMLSGFGLLGGALRRQRRTLRAA